MAKSIGLMSADVSDDALVSWPVLPHEVCALNAAKFARSVGRGHGLRRGTKPKPRQSAVKFDSQVGQGCFELMTQGWMNVNERAQEKTCDIIGNCLPLTPQASTGFRNTAEN